MLPNLKLLRREYGISQQKLADAIYVSQPSINKYENHNIEPEYEILIRMADYFDTTVDYLIGHSDVRHKSPQQPDGLTEQERALLARYRSLTEKEQTCINLTMEVFFGKNVQNRFGILKKRIAGDLFR